MSNSKNIFVTIMLLMAENFYSMQKNTWDSAINYYEEKATFEAEQKKRVGLNPVMSAERRAAFALRRERIRGARKPTPQCPCVCL